MNHDKTCHKNWAYWKDTTILTLFVEAAKSETCNCSIISHKHTGEQSVGHYLCGDVQIWKKPTSSAPAATLAELTDYNQSHSDWRVVPAPAGTWHWAVTVRVKDSGEYHTPPESQEVLGGGRGSASAPQVSC